VRALSIRKIFLTCCVIGAMAWPAFPQGGGNQTPGNGQPPPGQPTQPQPRANPAPIPQPATPSRSVFIRGRIIAGVHGFDSYVEVRFETDGGQPVGFAYADSNGEFNFEQRDFLDTTIYVVVKVDGYKPYRERLFSTSGVTIFLEREDKVVEKGGAPLIDLRQLRAKIPGKAVDEYEKALKESSKGNRSKAVEGFLRAIKLAPDFYEAQHSLALQYLAMQQYDDAETALLRARDLSPKAADPLINLGSLYYQRGEAQADGGRSEEAAATFQKAAEFLDEAIRRNPQAVAAHAYLGGALYKVGNYERAETVLNRALELDDDQQNARLMLVNVYTRSARYPEALKQINIFLTKYPNAPQRQALEKIKEQIEGVLRQSPQ
jgi:Tfp pilus assembly protein PilF